MNPSVTHRSVISAAMLGTVPIWAGAEVPRIKWAVRCHGHRTDGEPCGAWAVRGSRVCRAHGGSLRRTRQAATVRLAEIVMRRALATARAKWERQVIAFHAQRILVTSDLLGIPIEQITEADIWECRLLHGVPAPNWEEPKLRDTPLDGRYKRAMRTLAGER